jgi:type IV pilus assembly protein PilY1
MITDGESTMDEDIPRSDASHLPYATNLRDYDNDGNDPGSYPSSGSDYLDDLCLYGHTTDLRPDPGSGWGNRELEDDQSVAVFVIYAFGTSGSQLLMDAAKNGGFDDLNGNEIPDLQAEWDEDGDNIPDNYYQPQTGNELEVAVRSAIMQMLAKASSASGVAVVSPGTGVSGATAQSQFESGEMLDWIGTIQSLWLDPYGWLREDSDADAILHLQNDYVIRMEWSGSDVVVHRYQDVHGNGVDSELVYVGSSSIDDLKPLWDGGTWLWNNAPGARRILTFVDGDRNGRVDVGEIKDFVPGNASVLRPHLNAPTDEAADTIINYIRGTDIPGLRKRTADSKVWKLGDIINSGAISVQRPTERYDFIYGDNTYADYLAYYDLYRDQRLAVYVGANDGMLHCFNGGVPVELHGDPMEPMKFEPAGYELGEELWAYIPYNLLPHLQWLLQPEYCHVYYTDLKAYVTDARIFADDALHPHGWGRLLIGGMRLGGMPIATEVDTCSSAYFAIDVTDPLNPVPLWEFTDSEIGLTVCYSTVIKVGSSWYLVFGSGPMTCGGECTQQARIFVLDLETGALVKKWILPDNQSFVTNIMGADWGLDYTVDRIYFGDCYYDNTIPGNWGGKIYRILTGDDEDPNNWTLAAIFDMKRPITGEGSIATDDYNHLWLYFGTGRFFSDIDEADTTHHRYVGIREDTAHVFTVAGLYNVTDVWVDTNAVVHYPGGRTSTFEDLVDSVNTSAGWWREFDEPGERALTTSLVFGGAVLFTTFVPTADICSYGGEGNLWALYYRTGTAYIKPFLEPGESIRHPEKVFLGPGVPSEPSLYVTADQANVFIQASGAIVSPETGIPGLPKSGIIIWKGR